MEHHGAPRTHPQVRNLPNRPNDPDPAAYDILIPEPSLVNRCVVWLGGQQGVPRMSSRMAEQRKGAWVCPAWLVVSTT